MSEEAPESQEGQAPTGPPATIQELSRGTNDRALQASGHVHAHHSAIQFGFLEQLKHRNIIRVGILYLVACWLILDPVHVVFHMLEVPAWANRLVVILMVIGFPVVLLFSWVYEITPEGLKPTVEVDPHRSIRKLTARRLDRAIMVVLALGIAYLLVDKFWLSKHVATEQPVTVVAPGAPTVTSAATVISEKSVAVLPFVDMSEKHDQEYFSDGLSEELIDMLTKVPDLRVPARTSSFYFKGKQTTIADIARALSVAHVLEGSVRKSGNTIRITAQLIRVDNGYHVWSETFDRQLDDIFKVQDEISEAVVNALKASLLKDTHVRAARATDAEAYTLYLQARFLANRGTPAAYRQAIDYLQQALKLDPNFAPAWAELSRRFSTEAAEGGLSSTHLRESALRAAQRALALNPVLPEAHIAIGKISFYLDWNLENADAEVQKALALDPENADALSWGSTTARTLGRLDEAQRMSQQSIARDPLNPWNYLVASEAYVAMGRWIDAQTAIRKALELNPEMPKAHTSLAVIMLLAAGEPAAIFAEAAREPDDQDRASSLAFFHAWYAPEADLDATLADLANRYGADQAYSLVVLYTHRGRIDQAFAWLDRAYRQHDIGLTNIKVDATLAALRGDPRYKALLRKMNLPE